MKRLLFILLTLGICLHISGQYYAYTTNGEVRISREGTWMDVYVSMELFETDLLQTESYGNVVVLDRGNNKVYSIQSEEVKSLEVLIKNSQLKTRKLLPEFITGLTNRLFGGEQERTKGLQTDRGVTYRGEEHDQAIAQAVFYAQSSQYTVSFMLLDLQTLTPIQEAKEGQLVVVQFNNMSDTPLYMNIMDTDALNEQSAIFPFDEQDAMLKLYVPAFSSVRIKEYPISFAPAGTIDRLRLVAYPMPFDLSNAIKMIQRGDIQRPQHAIPVGFYHQSVPIR